MSLRALLFTSLLMSANILPAFADGEFDKIITAADRVRMEKYQATRKEAIDEAKAGGATADVVALDAIIRKEPQSWSDFDMTGNWQCRTIKAGGPVPLVIYGWFKCQVTDDGSGWILEKTTGSQRTKGRFYTNGDTRLDYLGSFFLQGEVAKPYGSGPESDQFGVALRTGAKEFRIEFPAPRYESKFDILELRR